MKNLIASIILFNFTFSTCSEGCLKCELDKTCSFCDTLSMYYLSSKKCIKVEIANCLKINLKGECIQCEELYYIKAPNQCEKSKTIINNCEIYQKNDLCKKCKNSYYINNGNCVNVINPIPNCETYKDESTCEECKESYILDIDKKKCNLTNIENCMSFSFFQCEECVNDYFFFNELVKEKNKDEIYQDLFNDSRRIKNVVKNNSCYEKKIDNCEKYENWEKCKICKSGYFLDSNYECTRFPPEKLKFCKKYENSLKCEECEQKFYLENDTTCKAVNIINNCKIYDGRKSFTFCLECEKEFFLENQYCSKRIISNRISKCEVMNKEKDLCLKCVNGYEITSDGLNCLETILACSNYEPSSIKDINLICRECDDDFYLLKEENKCKLGNVLHCQIYFPFNDVCRICRNSFYLKENKCEEHLPISNCLSYDPTIKNKCENCSSDSVKFEILNECKFTDSVLNCAFYSSQELCQRCKDGFYLENNKCLIIPEKLNCLQLQGNQCYKCKKNYFLKQGDCFKEFTFLQTYCGVDNFESEENFDNLKCSSCKENSLPVNLENNFICLESEYLENPILNCEKYDWSFNCLKCKDNFFLKDNTCFEQCDGSILKNELKSKSINYLFESEKKCINYFGCEYAASLIIEEKFEIDNLCVKCKTGFLTIIELFSNNNLMVNDFENSLDSSPVDFYDKVICLENSDEIELNGVLENNLVKNCEYYYMVLIDNPNRSQQIYGCIKCKFGYSGLIKNFSSSENGFIEECVIEEECKIDFKYKGENSLIKKIASCHKCKEENKIPFFALNVKSNNILSIISYGLNVNDQSVNYTGANPINGKSFFCANPQDNSFFKIRSDKFSFPTNCAIGALHANSEFDSSSSTIPLNKGGDYYKLAIFCLSCLPGYRANYFSFDINAIIKCEKIENCAEENKWMNFCSQCKENYLYRYIKGIGVIYDECIKEFDDPFCFAMEANQKCAICKKGYDLNRDKKCEKFSVPLCEANFNIIKEFPSYDIKTLLYLQKNTSGCERCPFKYFLVKTNKQINVCLKSDYIFKKEFVQDTLYIKNCKQYFLSESNTLKCKLCDDNFIINEDNDLCIIKNSLNFCLVAFSENKCSLCHPDYIVVANTCFQKNILYCLEYEINRFNSIQLCNKCDNGYYLKNGICEKGAVIGCKIYEKENKFRCEECQENFNKIVLRDFDYCLKIHTNCELFSLTDILLFKLNCQKCTKNYFLTNEVKLLENKNECVKLNKIENCVEYENDNLSKEIFTCKKCENDYFINNLGCKKRIYRNFSVLEYNISKDEANICIDSFYLENGKCLPNPEGIFGCEEYSNIKACIRCKTNYYLNNNNCVEIEEKDKISNCQYYRYSQECSECKTGFFLNNNTCFETNVINCAIFENPSNCKLCKEGYKLKNEYGFKICEIMPKNFCLEYSTSSPYNCILCDTNYYLNNEFTCEKITRPISNCLYYKNESQCERCLKGTVLSPDQRYCEIKYTEFLDYNCSYYKRVDTPICSYCNPGYYFYKGNCEKCFDSKGCFMCDVFENSKCVLCKSGYFHNEEFKCIPIFNHHEDIFESTFDSILNFAFFMTVFLD